MQITVASASLNQTPLDWDGNKTRILSAIAQAKALGVGVLCLPELGISGNGCEDALLADGTLRLAWQLLREILPATAGLITTLGLPLAYRQQRYNAVVLAADGVIAGIVPKMHLAEDDARYEPRWFTAWPPGAVTEIAIDGACYPFGDLRFACSDITLRVDISDGARRQPVPPGDADLLLNAGTSYFAFGAFDRLAAYAQAQSAGGVYLNANLVGNEAGRLIYDGAALIAAQGKLIACSPRFTFRDIALSSAGVDIAARPNAAANSIPITFSFPTASAAACPTPPPCDGNLAQREEEFTHAVALGLFDYMRKSRCNGFVLSLSGGTDSAAAAVLIACMVELGLAELGFDDFLAKLAYLPAIQQTGTSFEIIHEFLTCVYHQSRNTSDASYQAAQQLAKALGAMFVKFDMDALIEDYCVLGSMTIGRFFSWEQDDTALQNIQTRAHAPGAWLLANARNALLLSTSNYTEAEVGYVTMDGITCGGISPIAGMDRAFLCQWLAWMQQYGPRGLHNQPALAAVTCLPLAAELRPPQSPLTDESDLMPYPVLDAIELAAVHGRQSPLETYTSISAEFPQFPAAQVTRWVERFFTLWCRNEWKRERYAPAFHLDDDRPAPRTGYRFPILSGGFHRELAELKEHLPLATTPNKS